MIYIVLGMHKSGTTLIAKMLHKSGINMGNFDEKIDYDSGNHFESKETFNLNKEILGCGDDFSLMVKNPINQMVSDSHLLKSMREIIIRNNKKYKNWGFKDPRTCLTYGVWKSELPPHRVIFVYRHPFEVWSHYTKKLRFRNFSRRFWGSIQTWYIYNQKMLKHLDYRGEDSITINYLALMNSNDQEFRRLEKFLDRKLYDARENSLYRYHFKRKKDKLYGFISYIFKKFFSSDVNNLFEQFEEIRKKETKALLS
jgi:hypothetical protein